MPRVTWDGKEIGAVLEDPLCQFPLSSIRRSAMGYCSSIHNETFSDQSFLIYEGDIPICCVVRVGFSGKLSFFDQPFRVEFSEQYFEHPNRRDLDKTVLEAIWGRPKDTANGLVMQVPFAGERSAKIVEELLPFAESHSLCVEGYVDLDREPSELEINLRESHRRKIRKADSKFEKISSYCGDIDRDTFYDFQALHLAAAGRQTRPIESWEEQWKAIHEGRAALTTVVYDSELVGATFSWISPSSASYGTGAYDRSKFSYLSISHASLFRSIQHARSVGARRYFLGEVFKPDGTSKEKNIAYFKRGFSKTREHFHQLTLLRP